MSDLASRLATIIARNLWLALLIAAFAFSVLIRVMWPPQRVERVLFFPGTTNEQLTGETRLLPRVPTLEADVHSVARDLLLGPSGIQHSRTLPRATRVQSVIIIEDRLFLDLSRDALYTAEEVRAELDVGLEALRRTLLFNFRRFEEIVITIAGQVPYVSPFTPPGQIARAEGNKVVDKENGAAIISDIVLLLAELQAN